MFFFLKNKLFYRRQSKKSFLKLQLTIYQYLTQKYTNIFFNYITSKKCLAKALQLLIFELLTKKKKLAVNLVML